MYNLLQSFKIIFLNNLRNTVKGIFDNAKGGISFPIKMLPILKTNINNSKEIIIESAIERLSQVVKIFGNDVFLSLKIPLLTVTEFLDLLDDQKFKYTNMVYLKIIETLNIIITIFENFNMFNLKLHNLLNPTFIKIEESCFDEIEDLTDYFT